MTASVTALFATHAEAEAAAARLRRLGSDVGAVTIAGTAGGAEAQEGVFDRLARLIAPQTASGGGGAYQLTAQVAPERLEEAAELLEDRRIVVRSWAGAGDGAELMAERSWNFVETEERLDVATDARVSEEVVLRRDASERMAAIEDTVRRTQIEIEKLPPRR